MPICQFGERQYELAANLELLAGAGSFFTPTTSLEAHLAIDVAMTPGDPAIWTLLGVAPPRGVRAGARTFRHWPRGTPSSAIPPFLLSLFLQYKRCSHLTRARAKEWTEHGEPYWRIELSPRQHHTIQQLDTAVGADAVVRYAAPRFWRHEDIWRLQAVGEVLDSSLLVSPSAVHRRHTSLTWSSSVGLLGHSEVERLPVETTEDLAHDLCRRAAQRRRENVETSARYHLETLAEALVELAPSRRTRGDWRDDVRADQRLREAGTEDEAIEPLADMALIAEVATAARASWLMVAVAAS